MIYKTKDITIRPFIKKDLNKDYLKWMHSSIVTRLNSHGNFPIYKNDIRDFINSIISKARIVWSIFYKKKYIGNASLQAFNWIDRNAEVAILIGDKKSWGKNIGEIVIDMLFHHGFNKLNLHKIYLGTAESNIGMIRIAEKLGMQLEGRLRNHVYLNGSYYDILRYGILKGEYISIEC